MFLIILNKLKEILKGKRKKKKISKSLKKEHKNSYLMLGRRIHSTL